MARRILGWTLALSIVLILVALYLAQKEHAAAENAKSVTGIVTTLTGTSGTKPSADYTLAFIVGTIGVVGVVVSASLRRRDEGAGPSEEETGA